jgi:diguanylate cyclase (GGDEF)-like protein
MRRTDLSQAADPAFLRQAAVILHGLKYFDAIGTELLEKLVRRGTLVEIESGEVLIREGDTSAPELYVLVEGALLVKAGARLINRLDQPGEVIGELAVMQAPPRTADVVAESAARVLAIRPEVLQQPGFAGITATFYMMLSHSLAKKLRLMTSRSHKQLDRVEREASTDPLTGLANRKRLDEFLAGTAPASARSGKPFSLIMADVDHFKRYNDANGHPMGDVVLTKISMILQSNIRSGDLAARYGGEEFVVVLPNCDADNAAQIAGKLRAAVEGESFPQASSQPLGRVTATFGVATDDGTGDTENLLKRADQALYRGKAAGRNVVVTAD